MVIVNEEGRLFQSTLPRGSDLIWEQHRRCSNGYFNPRSLAGATMQQPMPMALKGNFNPRSLAGATQFLDVRIYATLYFNPRSLAGATKLPSHCDTPIISIHAPSRERPGACGCAYNAGYFNPRSLAGATIAKVAHISVNRLFQSTLPRGSD